MRLIRRIVVLALVLAVLFLGAIFGASELGGEVVTLRTRDAEDTVETRLWVVDDAGFAWLRAGSPSSAWLARIQTDPDVMVERNGVSTRYRAVPVPGDAAARDRIHALMREKYGFADRIVSLLGADRAGSIPVRLEPVEPQGASAPPEV